MDRRIKVFKASRSKDLKRINNKAFSNKTKTIELSKLITLKAEGVLSLTDFKENIGSIFPLILSMVADGHSILHIESFLGIKRRVLELFLQNNPRLNKAIKEARKIRLDKRALEDMLS
ncbi:MAG: hypothetical protein H0X02_00775 [Nitrosomonas sp.]|nr:hypothetical protein [Nitrosomonas sp.]